MHLVFDARSITDHYPGIGRYGSGLTHALAQRDDVRLTLLVDPRATNTFHSLPDVERVAVPHSPTSLGQQWVVPRLLKRLQADVYHSPYYLMPYLVPCPTVVTFYDLIPLLFPRTHSALFRLVYRGAHRLAAAAADRIIAISEATAVDLVRASLPAEKITTIALGVGSEFRPRSPREVGALRSQYNLPESFALYVGTNKPHKNLPRLIEAWASVTPSRTLVIAGREDPRYPRAADVAADFGARVAAIGGVDEVDLAVLYSAASLFVFPSLYEGFGLPVLEAMACGTPVICCNTSSLPEVASDAAMMVDPLDVGALTKTVERVLGDGKLWTELKDKGLAHAAAFSWERTARETKAIYDQALL